MHTGSADELLADRAIQERYRAVWRRPPEGEHLRQLAGAAASDLRVQSTGPDGGATLSVASVETAMKPLQLAVAGLLLAALLGSCASPGTTAPTSRAAEAAQQLSRLLADSDEAYLQRNPISALFRGDLRFAAQFGDYLSDAYVAAERAAAQADLRRLAAIKRAQLDVGWRAAYDTFEWQQKDNLRRFDPALAATWLPLTLEHFDGWHLFFPNLSSGDGVAAYQTVPDYDNGLSRIDGFITYLDRAVARAREGLAHGVTQPRIVIERTIAQFDGFAAQAVDESPYFGPIRKLPADMPAAEQERLRAAYRAAIHDRLVPAFMRVRDVLAREVLPNARRNVGLSQMPGGDDYYRFLVESQTTTTMAPASIHALGLSEVARIHAGM